MFWIFFCVSGEMFDCLRNARDTVITLTNGQIVRVRESAEEVVDRVVEFRRRISQPETLRSRD